ncbi:putative maltokinase [Rhizobium sp. FKL33]|uniref:putative maltokinase n=1 Tax=Rhizobium sp. FKL33 TaxID=2562307 RepID=UPI0010BFD640|nr:putative maltokinase [Rhizobium sp. FKL33]
MTHATSTTAFREAAAPPRLYFVHPLALKSEDEWRRAFAHARALGFDKVLTAPIFARPPGGSVFVPTDWDSAEPELGLGADATAALARLSAAAGEEGVGLMLDIVVDFEPDPRGTTPFDPRIGPLRRGGRQIEVVGDEAAAHWSERLSRFINAGVSGFRCMGLAQAPADFWRSVIHSCRANAGEAIFLAWTPGADFEVRRRLRGTGFDGSFSSFAWWDLESPWFAEEYELQRDLGWQIAFPEAPYGKRLAHGAESREILERQALRALKLADQIGDGLMVPMGFEYGATQPLDPLSGKGADLWSAERAACFNLTGPIRELNRSANQAARQPKGTLQFLAASGTPCLTLLRTDGASFSASDRLTAILVNRDLRRGASAPYNVLREASSGFLPLKPAGGDGSALNALARLRPGDIRIYVGERGQPIRSAVPANGAEAAGEDSRLAIEAVTPSVDGGRFPVKRIVGSLVHVEADIFGDGHDPLSAALLWRAADDAEWREAPMTLLVNDRWTADFTPQRLGRHEFLIEPWRNPFGIYRYELQKKHEARLDLTLELQEGAALIRKAEEQAEDPLKSRLRAFIERLAQAESSERVALLLSDNAFRLMAEADARPFRTRSAVIPLDAERREAAFASWYQIFPRSQSGDPHRHGTFDDVIKRLPAIRDMGFDVLYLPPIHPIGATNRKGRNNSLAAGPDDPGSAELVAATEMPFSNDLVLTELRVQLEGHAETYLLPLAVAWDDTQPQALAQQLTLARVRHVRRVGFLTDGFAAEAPARSVMRGLCERSAISSKTGSLEFLGTEALDCMSLSDDMPIRWLSAEQSNSSLILGDMAMIKLIRHIFPGIHPEVEMTRHLTKVGYANTPPLLGEVARIDAEGERSTLMIVQGAIRNQGDAWTWMLNELRHRLEVVIVNASGEEAASEEERDPFNGLIEVAGVVGKRLGELHAALALPSEDPDFAPATAGETEAETWRKALQKKLGDCLDLLSDVRPNLDPACAQYIDPLLEQRARLLDAASALSRSLVGAIETRVHGDFHLGQALVAEDDVYIIDFEGEPARALSDRRAKTSPLRDVAGLLRSISYLAASAGSDRDTAAETSDDHRAQLTERFKREAETAFLERYAAAIENNEALSMTPERRARLIDLFLLEKAAYEIGYEARNRTGWLPIPLKGCATIANRLMEAHR